MCPVFSVQFFIFAIIAFQGIGRILVFFGFSAIIAFYSISQDIDILLVFLPSSLFKA